MEQLTNPNHPNSENGESPKLGGTHHEVGIRPARKRWSRLDTAAETHVDKKKDTLRHPSGNVETFKRNNSQERNETLLHKSEAIPAESEEKREVPNKPPNMKNQWP